LNNFAAPAASLHHLPQVVVLLLVDLLLFSAVVGALPTAVLRWLDLGGQKTSKVCQLIHGKEVLALQDGRLKLAMLRREAMRSNQAHPPSPLVLI
jgi:hypothetical protein